MPNVKDIPPMSLLELFCAVDDFCQEDEVVPATSRIQKDEDVPKAGLRVITLRVS